MNDETTVDSGTATPEEEQVSQPETTSEEAVPQQEANSLAGEALAEAALKDPKAAEKLRRQFQSDKDKGVAQATKDAQEARTLAEQLARKFGIDDPGKIEPVQREIILDQLVAERTGVESDAPVSEQASPEMPQQGSSLNFLSALERNKIDPNNVPRELTEKMVAFEGTQEAFENQVFIWNSQVPDAPDATASSAISPQGSSTPPASDEGALLAESASLQGKPHGMKIDGDKTVGQRRNEISEQLEKLEAENTAR